MCVAFSVLLDAGGPTEKMCGRRAATCKRSPGLSVCGWLYRITTCKRSPGLSERNPNRLRNARVRQAGGQAGKWARGATTAACDDADIPAHWLGHSATGP